MKKKLTKKQSGGPLTSSELEALAHQKRGMGQISSSFIKKAGPIKNELGKLTPAQVKQLEGYMNKSSTIEKIYQGLPNVGRAFGKSAADIPKGSQLEKQKKGGSITVSMKEKGKVPKGYHRMPDGKIMKDSAHKTPAKKKK